MNDFTVRQSVTRTFGYNEYVKVRLENIPFEDTVCARPLTMHIGKLSTVLTKKQLDHIAVALQMDEDTLQIVRILEQRIIRGDAQIKKDLIKLCEV
jgi:hypothetical protein